MPFVLVNKNHRTCKQTKKNYALFIALFFIWAFSGLAVCAISDAQEIHGEAADHNRQGLNHFNNGFSKLSTKNKKEEATRSFILAEKEFKKAIALDQKNIQAHRNLARVYYIQKKYLDAARQYKKVVVLNPADIDTHIIIALAYSKTQQYDEAIEQLTTAKTMTADDSIIRKLDGFIEKLEQEKGLR